MPIKRSTWVWSLPVPVYSFIAVYLLLLVVGLVIILGQGSTPPVALQNDPAQPVTLFLVLHAFATGSTALTGIEAISNGVPYFEPPEPRNAGRTLKAMASLMAILLLGTNGLTQFFSSSPLPDETILSALARHLLGATPPGTIWYRS